MVKTAENRHSPNKNFEKIAKLWDVVVVTALPYIEDECESEVGPLGFIKEGGQNADANGWRWLMAIPDGG